MQAHSTLPQRVQAPKVRYAQRVGLRNMLLGAIVLLVLLAALINVRFSAHLAKDVGKPEMGTNMGISGLHDSPYSRLKQPRKSTDAADLVGFAPRHVHEVVFMSGCSEQEFVKAEVLAHSARSTGYKGKLTHLLYACRDKEYEDIKSRKNPAMHVDTVAVKSVQASSTMFGQGLLTTTMHPLVLKQWFTEASAEKHWRDDSEVIMVAESDAIFTKNVDIWDLLSEVEDVVDPQWFGQDACWYKHKNQMPLTKGQLQNIMPSNSKALRVANWRPYAATGPYVMEVGFLRKVLPVVAEVWPKLDLDKRYLAFPLASAHLDVPFGISGVLNVHHYTSPYENWNFVDDGSVNPCNESSSPDVKLESFPITLRAANFSLPQWIDGREWSFLDGQLPSKFLDCDAWMLREPTGYLWHLASNTNGYERVPTILRRRHTMSVCLTLRAYNSMARAYKQQHCPLGFNENKVIPMYFNGSGQWKSALAKKDAPVPMFGEVASKAVDATPRPGTIESDQMHFVYVTSCSASDNWQSDLLTHSFARVKQRGRLTRIVAGCSSSELKDVLARTALYPHLNLFMTRGYSSKPTDSVREADDYKPYNVPFAIRDWIAQANPPVNEELVVVLDASYMFLRSIAVNSQFRVTRMAGVNSENYDEDTEVIEGLRQYKRFFIYQGQRSMKDVSDEVKNGVAIAQRNVTSRIPYAFDPSIHDQVCPTCSVADAKEFYGIRLPLIITKNDLASIVEDYAAMAVKVREMNRHEEFAEGMALGLAAAKHNVRFTAFSNLVLPGQPDSKEAYWGFLAFLPGRANPCEDPQVPYLFAEMPLLLDDTQTFKAVDSDNVEWMYSRSSLPDNLFACDSWLLAVPPASLWKKAERSREARQLEQTYGLCTAIKLVNEAIIAQKQRACPNGFNSNRKLRLVSPRPAAVLNVQQVHARWQAAVDATQPAQ